MTEKHPTRLTGIVEADETYVGGKPRGHWLHRQDKARSVATERGIIAGNNRGGRTAESWERKTGVFGVVERGGRVRTHAIPRPNQHDVRQSLADNVDFDNAALMTDESRLYHGIGTQLPHDTIRHKSEYVRGEVHTQAIESFWALLKRGIVGTYHHVDAGYLNQYVQEYAFRYNTRKITDAERFSALVASASGRLDWNVGKKSLAASLEEGQP
jgi:hypothetical protein